MRLAAICVALTCFASTLALAQERPTRPDGPPVREGGPGGQRPDGPMRPRDATAYDIMRAWLDMVDRYARTSKDPGLTGVAAVLAANDTLRAKGAPAAIDYFNKILPEAKNESVKRTIQLVLIDLYRQANQPDKALDLVQQMVAALPADGTPPKP